MRSTMIAPRVSGPFNQQHSTSMKSKLLALTRRAGLVAIAAFAVIVPAKAVPTVSLDPVTQNIAVGGTAVVNLNISGLGAGVTPTLGSWLAYIAFDSLVVSIGTANVTFGTNLDLGVIGTISLVDGTTPNLIKIDETSFEDMAALNLVQPAAFTLATLTFTGVAQGTSALTFNRLELGDEMGFPLALSSSTASITVGTPTGVPEGGSLLPLLVSCIGLVVLGDVARRRRSAGLLAL